MTMTFSPYRSLLTRILILVLAMQAVVMLGLTSVFKQALNGYAQAQFEQLTAPIESLVNNALAPALFAEDIGALRQRTLQIQADNPLLAYLVVIDPVDKVLVSVGDFPAPSGLAPAPSANAEPATTAVHAVTFPVQLAGEAVGQVQMGVRRSPLHRFEQQLTLSTLVTGAAYLALSTFLIGLILWYFTRRLRQLDIAAQAVSKGSLIPVDESGPRDEVGRLAHSFNGMVANLRDRVRGHEEEKTRLRAIADYTFAWEIWLDNDNRLIWTNPSAQRVTGYPPDELLAMQDFPDPLLLKGSMQQVSAWQRLLHEPRGENQECVLRRKDGSTLWAAIYWQPIIDASGLPRGKRASFIDVTERLKAQQVLNDSLNDLRASEALQQQLRRQSEGQRARFRALLSAMNMGILFETTDRRVEYVNPAFLEMWALEPLDDLVDQPVEVLPERFRHLFIAAPGSQAPMLSLDGRHDTSDRLDELELADGRILSQAMHPVRDNENRIIGRLWLYEDITHDRQTAEQLIYLAERDSLTGLYNRHRFQSEMDRMINLATRFDHRFALLYFDLDEFKVVNDTYGHREGDTVLTRIAGELARVIRKNDVFARVGGDEFAVITLIDQDLEEVKQLAQRIVNAVARIPFRLRGQNIRITASVGIAVFPDMTREPETLIAQADAAMYQAKAQGKNTCSLYDRERDNASTMMAHMNWTQRIEHGLENDLFELHYQGIYTVAGRELVHLEALVRLRDTDHADKLFMPAQFIPIAEKNGKILAIDQWVVRRVIELLGQHPAMPPVAVNISGRSFDDPSLPQRIRQWLLQNKVRPARLMIELTETAAVSDIQDAQRFIQALHQTGCQVCLDDFGAGFSSFAYLKHIAADVLKIDGQFIHDLPNNPENQIFLRAMLDVATGLRKTTVAEFVDSEAVLVMIGHFGVDLAQGYFLDRPSPDHPAVPRHHEPGG